MVRIVTMPLKYCILLAIFLGYGLCVRDKNISRKLNGTVNGNQTLTRADGPYLVTSDLVVPENVTLTIEPGVIVNFVPSVGIRVRGLFYAKGTPSQRITLRTVPDGEASFRNKTDGAKFYSPGVRLVDGTSYNNGRLELQYNGRWGTVCNSRRSWDISNTQVACRQLGFLGAKRYFYDPGSGPMMMKNVNCKGTETRLWDCPYTWIMNNPYSCGHSWDVGIECDTLLPYLAETFYWKGIFFDPRNSSEKQGSSSLVHVNIEKALEGVNAVKSAPELLHVTINDSASGLNLKELSKPLAVVDCSILRPMLAGVSIESFCGNAVIENVTVQSARFGGGLVFKHLAVNFCSVIPEKASFPLFLNAAGNHQPVNCIKVFRASPRRKISVHLRKINGSGFELNITDGSAGIKTQLHRITSDYNGRTIKTGPSFILEISFYSKGNSKAPANLEMIIREDQGETLSLLISNSTFSENSKSGITVDNLIGNSRISQTTVIGNNYYGLYASDTQGKISVVTSVFLRNKYNGVNITKMAGTLELINVNSSKNQASGIVIDAGTLSFQMSDSLIEENAGHGLHILNQVNSTIKINNTQIVRNSNGEGIYLQALRSCHVRLAEVLSLGNSQNGALLTRLSDTRLNVTSCKFDGNSYTGVHADYFLKGELKLENISTSNNFRYGYIFHFGDTSINIESSSSFGNGRDGFYVENQEGEVVLKDFAARGNKRHGLWFVDDNSARLRSVYLLNCNISENSQYGVRFYFTYRFTQGTENYTINVENSTISNNPLGGFTLYPSGCSWGNVQRQRRVQVLFTGNEVKGNAKNALDILGPQWYELSAALDNNRFYENSGLALIVRQGQSCSHQHSSSYKLQVSSNIFLKNKGENIFLVNCETLPTKCRVIIRNNTFLENQRIRPFSRNYLRTKTQAVLAVKGGNVTIKYNSFINPLFSQELAALLKDREHVIQAEENWWGTKDECKIKDRLFDFEDRVELAQIHYYPFLDSHNSTAAKLHNGARPLCFLRGDRLGGTLNQVLNITNENDVYRVISDVTILSDGVLCIEENVTLEFPLKSVFLVQGKVIIKGTEKERVKFLPRGPLNQDVRLVQGPAPWEGVVEIWVNRTWMPVCIHNYRHEYDIVCRILGYEPENSYYHDKSGRESIFLHNLRCDTDQGDNITICNKNNWISSSSCSAYVLYVGCKIPYWAGIHLAVTPKKSVVRNLELRYAGCPYRDDLGIPGIAFRVDLPRHTISGVSVSNSASIGFQIMYPDPVEDSYRITNSTIDTTESDGIRLESPFLELLGATVVNTKGYGFSYRYNWNALNTHVVTMADATMKKYLDMCSESETFIGDSSVMHYLVVKAKSRAACDAIVTVPQEYTIGLQLIYHNVHGIVFHVYNRTEKPKGIYWDIHMLDWYSRPVWMSGNSSILLEKGRKYYTDDSTVHFLLFLIKSGEKTKVRSPNLLISKGNFSHNTKGGIFLGGDEAGMVEIQHTEVRNSPQNGLSTAFSYVNSLKLLNCQFVGNKIGIRLSSFSGNVNVESSKASNSTENGLYVDTNGEKSIYIENGGVFYSNGYGVYLRGSYTKVKLSATRTFFGWNKASSVYSRVYYGCSLPCSSHTIFTNCTFYANRGPVVDINESPHSNPWQFDGNFFLNNTQGPVILTTKDTRDSYTPELFLRNNYFLFNFCQDKSVIDIKGGTKVLIMEGNVFEKNYGRSIFLEKTSPSGATIRSNVFTDNKCLNSGVIEIQRMDKDILIVDNTFKFNKGLSMVFLHCEYVVEGNTPSGIKNVTFSNNSLISNIDVSLNSPTCEVRISGFIEWRTFFVNNNRFSSVHFSKELCVNTFASSHSSAIQASLNFWGYDDEEKIKERIFDAEDNYEHTFADFRPYISSAGNTVEGSPENMTRSGLTKSFLGGRILSNILLRKEKSPYTVVSDVTILPEASLTINPGVEVQFMPGVGILVLGSIFVRGNGDQPIQFSLSNTKKNISLKIRLAGGKFPWEGRVEILHSGNWTPLHLNVTEGNKGNVTKLVCEHLGYKAPLSIHYSPYQSLIACDACAALHCKGSEVELTECTLSFHKLSCNTSHRLVLNCGGGRPWGNIRFLREARDTPNLPKSSLKHLRIVHCGVKHGEKVAAIELIQYVPEVSNVTVLNCTSGGIKVWFPEKEVTIRNSSFVNTGGNGTDLIITKKNITLENVKSMNNEFGLSFREEYGDWINGISYGQINLCSPQKVVNITDHDLFIYFRASFQTFSNLKVSCKIKIQTEGDAGFAIQLLVMRSSKSIEIETPHGRKISGQFSKRRMMGWDSFTVNFKGWYSSEMLLKVQRVDSKDIPCSFDHGFCDWRRYPKSRFRNNTLTQQWHHGWENYGYDHTYSMYEGRILWIEAKGSWTSGYGAFASPSIFNDSNYCFLVFYYKLDAWGSRKASISVYFVEDNTDKSTLLWSTSDSVNEWEKKVIELPSANVSYSIVLLGYVESWGYVFIDDLAFVRRDSSAFMHQVTGSVFSGNVKQGVRYTSTQSERRIFRLKRCQVTNNGLNPVLSGRPSGAIHFTAVKQEFEIVNNYIAGNNNGGIYCRIFNELSTSSLPVSHIHANTIENNKGGILQVEGVSEPYMNVIVSNNYFSQNLAQNWDGTANNVCVITKFTAIVQGNFFYNNVGHYVFLYDNSQTSIVGLRFVNNTLYKNGAQGLNVNYGATILCNGAAEILGNVLQNPNNRYQISTTMRGSPITVNATSNWWGESVPNLIYSVILDKTTDYRLSMTVVFQPFVKLPPQTAISVSCPPEWIKDDEMCFMYKGGSFTFSDAKKYCESYGGNLNTMISNEDKRLIKHLRQRESLVRSAVLPSLWTISRRSLKESHGGYVQNSKVCPVVAASGNISQVHCGDLHPFVCVRRPVIHCPNSCFHNGDCIGATCFCHPGWTGEDCSKFHCHDLHNCSGNGQCMGPNVCKCYPGYLGIGCTFSFCGKYESCADCVTDPFCGWCDSSRSCRGGFPAGPLGRSCLAWFYYHCYTVGDEHCSRDIMRVNCRGKYCNFKDGRATIESCQKCHDLERCHKLTEESQCTSWNETQCPGGKIVVNYTDPLRRDNVEFAKNVKFVEPNETLVYACPVILPKQDRVSLVLVAPRALKVQKGDILCSPQAGGIMHKIVKEIKDGPFQLMLSTPAGFEEIIKYADFKEEVTAIQVDDGSTFEDEPDQDDLWDVISGNITFDEGRVIVLSNEIYKCLGHTYDTGKITVHSYFLVIEKNNTTLKTGDVVVSNASDGFIETVVAVHRTNNTEYLETKFQRCEASSHWQGTRLQESKKRLSGSVPCSGGDNNEGLVFSKQEDGGRQFSVNDSIIGRPSGGFIAKVIDVYSSQSFLLVEVISAKLDGNGTIITAVDIHALKSHNRRSRRSTRYDSKLASFKPDGIHHKLLSTENAKIQVSLEMLLKVTMFLEIEKRSYGFGIEDATVGLELKGSLDFSLEFRVEKELKYNKGLNVMREKQLGRSIYIRVGPIKIPAGIFLEITGHASAELSGKISRSLSVNGKVSLGGECRWSRGSCYKTADTVTLRKGWNSPHAQLEAGASVKVTVTPKISVKLPAFPKSQTKAVKILDFSLFDDLVEAVFERVDLSMAVYVSVPLEAGLSIRLPATQCSGNKPAEFESFYGISGVNVGVSVGFLEKHLTLEVPLGYSQRKRHSNCICPVQSEKICLGPPTTRPGPPGNENPTTDPNRRPRPPGNGNPTPPFNPRPRPPGIGNPTPAPNPRPRPPGNRNPTPAPNPRPGPPGTGNPTPAPNPRPRPTGNGNPTSVPSSRPTPTENGNATLTPTPPPTNKTGNKPPPSGKTGELPCGKGPICAGNRTGPNCTKPDTPLLQNCSGNGNPIIGPKCEALCNCSGGWEGEFCERLIANGGGDPHLETLDGVNFDFFGIGEFWGCKSVKNDFGLQFRFYYYERASLIGGIALKAGRSVVTIMTIKTEKVQDLPITRIDGAEMNATSNSSDPVEISNGTVLLDRQRRFSFEAEENSVVLISLQYDAGVTVTIDVRHSRVMKRQYLNILYSPTAAYKGHTEGLCGFMDNNATNDFIGSDGTLYDDAIKFAESWRITDCHSGSGTRDSWSWNSSNFYHDDVMDITYTDPSYIPTYLLDGISQSVLQIATSMCKSLKISDNKLKSCIFDVAMTNDTTFTDQETFKRDCPDQCSGKGRCVNGTCKCIEGWTGKSCDKGSCLNCSTIHGECVKGFCVCDLGWEGRSCEVEATCFGVNNCTSPEHGSCKMRDVCQCTPGYIGANCSIVPTCNDVSNCAGNGICVDFNVCKCKMGWTGSNCAQYSCEQLDYCSVHGSCVAFDRCACDYGWTGVSCALPDCEAVNHCSKKGECISSDKCRCFPGFVGADCSQVGDCSHLANCSGHGVCISTELLNVSCSCYLGFTGDNCSQPTCTTVNNCSAHGVCVEAEFCKCDFGYTGADCSNFSCEAVNYCSGNGKCVGYDLCLCNSSWSGRACSVPDCSAVKNCSDQGNCILPNVCSCYPAFDGAYCDQEAKSNINAPKFNQTFYSATIVENSPVGTVILQVKATDRDLGKNGQIFYAILGDDNIESILTVGGQSGKVYSAQTLDFETNEVKSFNVTMVAADDGYPQKSGITTVQITLLDENDNCPTYIEPPGDLKLELPALISGETVTKVFAVDLDSGVNSDITYSLSKNDAFSIHPKTGVVTAVSDLKNKVYHLTVSASDNGDISCVTDINLTVKVGFSPTTKPLTRSTNSSTNKKSEAPSTHKVGFSPTTNPLTRSTNSFTNKKSEASSTHSPPMLPETTSFTRATTSNVPTRADAVPQGGSIYVVIGGSAAGGVVLLLIVVLVIRKCLGKSRISPAKHMTGRLNAGMDFELSRRM